MKRKQFIHPYIELEGTTLWGVIENTLHELIANKDLEIQTREEYIIGYICQAIQNSKSII